MSEKSPKLGRRTWLIALLLSVLWVAALYTLGPRARSGESFGDREVRFPASYEWTLYDLDDRPVSFERFKGKAIFLNIWATWCPPCISEMPSIARLAEDPRLSGKNVEFVCVSTDDSAIRIRHFLQGKGWKMTFLRATSLPDAYHSEGIPATYALSPDGLVVGALEGSNEWDNPGVVSFLEKLASAPAAASGSPAKASRPVRAGDAP